MSKRNSSEQDKAYYKHLKKSGSLFQFKYLYLFYGEGRIRWKIRPEEMVESVRQPSKALISKGPMIYILSTRRNLIFTSMVVPSIHCDDEANTPVRLICNLNRVSLSLNCFHIIIFPFPMATKKGFVFRKHLPLIQTIRTIDDIGLPLHTSQCRSNQTDKQYPIKAIRLITLPPFRVSFDLIDNRDRKVPCSGKFFELDGGIHTFDSAKPQFLNRG